MLSRVRSFTSSYHSVVLLLTLAGCAEGADKSGSSDSDRSNKGTEETDFQIDEALLRQNVSEPIAECEGLRDACQPDGGRGKPSQACQSEAHACFTAVAERALAVLKSLHECKQGALACLKDDGERATCKEQFEGCVQSAFGLEGGDGGLGRGGRDRDRDRDDDDRRPGRRLDGGIGLPRPERPERPTRPTRPQQPGPRGGDRLPPLPTLDAGVPSDDTSEAEDETGDTGGSAPSADCLSKLQECAEKNQDNPEACAEQAAACLSGN